MTSCKFLAEKKEEDRVIVSIGDASTRKFVESGRSKFSGMDEAMADQRIGELDAATRLDDLGALKSVGLHKLHGPLKDFWSININGRWRLIFRFDGGNAYDVQIGDTH